MQTSTARPAARLRALLRRRHSDTPSSHGAPRSLSSQAAASSCSGASRAITPHPPLPTPRPLRHRRECRPSTPGGQVYSLPLRRCPTLALRVRRRQRCSRAIACAPQDSTRRPARPSGRGQGSEVPWVGRTICRYTCCTCSHKHKWKRSCNCCPPRTPTLHKRAASQFVAAAASSRRARVPTFSRRQACLRAALGSSTLAPPMRQ